MYYFAVITSAVYSLLEKRQGEGIEQKDLKPEAYRSSAPSHAALYLRGTEGGLGTSNPSWDFVVKVATTS